MKCYLVIATSPHEGYTFDAYTQVFLKKEDAVNWVRRNCGEAQGEDPVRSLIIQTVTLNGLLDKPVPSISSNPWP
jgi:hypothetical protein